jgi:hypothetical protein
MGDFDSDTSLTDIFGYMILEVQRQVTTMAKFISGGPVHKLISDLRSLSQQLQHPSRRLALSLNSTFLLASFSDLPKINLLGGLIDVLSDIKVHLFQFVHATGGEQQNAAMELHQAEEKLKILGNFPTVKQLLKRVQSSSSRLDN